MYDKIKNAIIRKGYKFFTGERNLNIVGVRSSSKVIDRYNDKLYLLQEIDGKPSVLTIDEFTTDPGKYYLQKKLLNEKGTAVVVPGQYPGLWKQGLHNGRKALVQVGLIKVYRDGDMDAVIDFDPKTIQESSILGINLHDSAGSELIGPYSAGCQVCRRSIDLMIVLQQVQKSAALYGDSFTYTLLLEEDLCD